MAAAVDNIAAAARSRRGVQLVAAQEPPVRAADRNAGVVGVVVVVAEEAAAVVVAAVATAVPVAALRNPNPCLKRRRSCRLFPF